jgi:hypothetical protein
MHVCVCVCVVMCKRHQRSSARRNTLSSTAVDEPQLDFHVEQPQSIRHRLNVVAMALRRTACRTPTPFLSFFQRTTSSSPSKKQKKRRKHNESNANRGASVFVTSSSQHIH